MSESIAVVASGSHTEEDNALRRHYERGFPSASQRLRASRCFFFAYFAYFAVNTPCPVARDS
jgi:hypothetical protein